MSSMSKSRLNHIFRIQSYEGTPDELLVDYLKSLVAGQANLEIKQLLRMGLLPFAYQYKGKLSPDQLKLKALEAVNALEQHANYIRQAFDLERPQQQIVMADPMVSNGTNGLEHSEEVKQEKQSLVAPAQSNSICIAGVGSKADIDAIFGDFD